MAKKVFDSFKNFTIEPRDLFALIIIVAFAVITIKSKVDTDKFMIPLTTIIAFYFGISKRSSGDK